MTSASCGLPQRGASGVRVESAQRRDTRPDSRVSCKSGFPRPDCLGRQAGKPDLQQCRSGIFAATILAICRFVEDNRCRQKRNEFRSTRGSIRPVQSQLFISPPRGTPSCNLLLNHARLGDSSLTEPKELSRFTSLERCPCVAERPGKIGGGLDRASVAPDKSGNWNECLFKSGVRQEP